MLQATIFVPQETKTLNTKQMTTLQKISDMLTSAGIAAVGIVGVEKAPEITDAMPQISESAAKAGQSPDWIEPLLQGLIAVITIIAQFLRNRPKKERKQ